MERLIYGFDPLCGWCFGIVPAMRRVRADHPDLPIRMVFPGLVTGARIGPYAEMEGYIRTASDRLRAVTGRAPSAAFFEMIRTPGVMGDSGPPTAVLAAVGHSHPDRVIDLAHAMTEAHFRDGADLNRPETHAALFAALDIRRAVPPLDDTALIAATWAEGRGEGITSFPTLILESDVRRVILPPIYDPAALSAGIATRRAKREVRTVR